MTGPDVGVDGDNRRDRAVLVPRQGGDPVLVINKLITAKQRLGAIIAALLEPMSYHVATARQTTPCELPIGVRHDGVESRSCVLGYIDAP